MVNNPSLSSWNESEKSLFSESPGSKNLLRQSTVLVDPFALRIISPGFKPARSAGLDFETSMIITPFKNSQQRIRWNGNRNGHC